MNLRHLLSCVFLLGFATCLVAQPARQAENWHFGNGYLITFGNDRPTLSGPSAMVALEGCVSMSNERGEIQFYSNGGGRGIDQDIDGVIWNKNNDRMFDWATFRGGGISARQSSIAFPAPGRPNVYYLFTMEDRENAQVNRPPGNGLSYYVVDMNQDANLGKVTEERQTYVPNVVEALDATAMADGSGYWVIANLDDGGNPKIVTIPVTADGVGAPVNKDFPFLTERYTFSPDGNFLFASDNLLAYDNATGTPGEILRNFPNSNSVSAGFTADSRFMYLIESVDFGIPRLVRYDLEDFTRLEVALLDEGFTQGAPTSAFQLGPNGNLYYLESEVETGSQNTFILLNEIACPSNSGPDFRRGVLRIDAGNSSFGLSNLPQYVDDIFIGTSLADTIILEPLTIENCPDTDLELAARVEGNAYLWSDESTDSILVVREPGEYCVTITNGCETTFDCQTVIPTSAPTADEYRLSVTATRGEICDGREAIVRVLHVANDTTPVDIVFFDGTRRDSLLLTLAEGDEISATVTDSCGATNELIFLTAIEGCTCDDPVFPEIISANQDGLNDEFRAFSECELTDYSLLIYNRWGQEVFSTNTYTEGWDGTTDGKPQNVGTYLFLSSYRIEGMGEVMSVEGQFSLVR
ncbi:gliding motility-associated C-terminal domain-containing protein [Lewinella sp. 4G2]|uniref:T9SS type B sorting domain-containing protein n=1 Tax=Lewinella sp. 4G2 TaxID=1803372 RepID=UPI0007B4BF49|nr:gliding motility-associated C-terminal domain-containing protein [Lewinella sp. 4G2]OAV44869.1 hypothetical protein A3850_010365 [Lewinella sp. 4G2]